MPQLTAAQEQLVLTNQNIADALQAAHPEDALNTICHLLEIPSPAQALAQLLSSKSCENLAMTLIQRMLQVSPTRENIICIENAIEELPAQDRRSLSHILIRSKRYKVLWPAAEKYLFLPPPDPNVLKTMRVFIAYHKQGYILQFINSLLPDESKLVFDVLHLMIHSVTTSKNLSDIVFEIIDNDVTFNHLKDKNLDETVNLIHDLNTVLENQLQNYVGADEDDDVVMEDLSEERMKKLAYLAADAASEQQLQKHFDYCQRILNNPARNETFAVNFLREIYQRFPGKMENAFQNCPALLANSSLIFNMNSNGKTVYSKIGFFLISKHRDHEETSKKIKFLVIVAKKEERQHLKTSSNNDNNNDSGHDKKRIKLSAPVADAWKNMTIHNNNSNNNSNNSGSLTNAL